MLAMVRKSVVPINASAAQAQQAGGEHQKPWQQQQQRRRPHQRQLPTLPKGQVWGSYVSRPRRQRHQQHQGGKPSCT